MDDKAQVLVRLKSGDRDAFAEIVEQHSPQIYNLSLRMMGDPAEAEEILQETFLQAFKHIGAFRGQSKLGTWLYRIATNQALMRLRRKRPLYISLDNQEEEGATDSSPHLADWSVLPESEMLNREARAEMDKAIIALPEKLRVVFILRDLEGLSTAETAEALELSISAVKSRLMRARLNLRDQLAAYFGRLGNGEQRALQTTARAAGGLYFGRSGRFAVCQN